VSVDEHFIRSCRNQLFILFLQYNCIRFWKLSGLPRWILVARKFDNSECAKQMRVACATRICFYEKTT